MAIRRWCSVLKSHQCRISIRQMPSSSKFVVRTHRFEATDDVSRRDVSVGCRFRGSKCPQNLRNGYSTRKADDTDGIREGCQSLGLLLLTFKNIFWPSPPPVDPPLYDSLSAVSVHERACSPQPRPQSAVVIIIIISNSSSSSSSLPACRL